MLRPTRHWTAACALAASVLSGCGGHQGEPLPAPPPGASSSPAGDEEPPPAADASVADQAAALESPAAGSASAEPASPPAPPQVEVTEPSFVGEGTVPKVEGFLAKTREAVAQCVADNGGLSEEQGEMKVQFLVTLRAKAEGVDVSSSKGVTQDAERCVRDALRGKSVATPTADPVGVQFRYRFTRVAN